MPRQMRLDLEPEAKAAFPSPFTVYPVFDGRATVVRLDPEAQGRWANDPKNAGLVGKVFRYRTWGWTFFSDHKATRTHRSMTCPLPLDRILLTWLVESAIPWITHYDRDNEVLYRQQTEVVANAGTRVMDGQAVYLLPVKEWATLPNIIRWREKGSWIYGTKTKQIALVAPYVRAPDITLREAELFS